MKSINIDASSVNISEQMAIKNASELFNKGNYRAAYDQFYSLYSQGLRVQNLQMMIGSSLFKLNDYRMARLFIFQEVLDYPKNGEAINLLNDLYVKINGRVILHHFNNGPKPKNLPTISLVLIVKNEEKTLPKCLDSFKDIVQEMIVVDTGSTDRTVEVAKSFGARVEYYQWTNDFAAARNESMKYATCGWILRTDADEYIKEEEKNKLLQAIASGLAEIYICPTLSGNKQEGEIVGENVRLIKNHLGVTFESPIHENIAVSAIKLGLTQCSTNIQFRHSGYDNLSDEEWKRKLERNITVCDETLHRDPKNYFVRLIKGVTLMHHHDDDEGVLELETALKNLDNETMGSRYLGLGYFYLSKVYVKQKKIIELNKLLLDMTIDFNSFSTYTMFIAEQYLYQLGNMEKAEKLFEYELNSFSQSKTFEDTFPENEYNLEKVLLYLIEISLFQHNYQKMKKYLRKFENEIDVNKKKVNEDKKQQTDEKEIYANRDFESLRKNAKTLIEKRDWNKAYHSIILAAARDKLTAQDIYDLAICKTQMNHTFFAHFLVTESRKINPESAIPANIDSLIYVREENNEKAVEKAVEAFITEPGNSGYKSNLEQIASNVNLSPVQALRKIGLFWIDNDQLKNGLFALTMYLKFQPNDEEIRSIISKFS